MSTTPSVEQNDNNEVDQVVTGVPATADAGAESSTAANVDKPEAAEAGAKGEEANGAKTPKSPFEAAKAALNKAAGTETSPVTEATKDAKDGTAKDGVKDPATPEPFDKHPRWIELRAEVKEAKADAESWRRFNDLIDQSGFGNKEAVTGWLDGGASLNRAGVNADERGLLLEFATASKTNPARAFEIITPIYNALQSALGEVLPDDLKQAVANGEMTEEAARRLAKSEATSRIDGQRLRMTGEEAQRQREAVEAQADSQAAISAVVSWERQQAATNPDWSKISPAVVEAVTNLRDARKPRTAAESVQVCNDALAFVKRTMGIGAAPKPAVTPPNTNTSTSQTLPRPKSVFEAAKRGLGG